MIDPGSWYSLLPALTAIVLALITKRIVPSLVGGVFLGAWMAIPFNGMSWLVAAGDVVDTYVLRAIVPEDGSTSSLTIIVFSLLIGGMVGIIRNNGGTAGIVSRVSRFATSRTTGQQSTFLLGLAIFFDDYANSMIVGNAMRPVTDALRISREKLAFIVDATAAPVASLFLVTTWIGYEVGLFEDALSDAGMAGIGYATFLQAIPYSFYPILMIVLVGLIVSTNRDFGLMLAAEKRAVNNDRQNEKQQTQQELKQDSAEREVAPAILNALIPIGTLLVVTLIGIVVTGSDGTTVGEILNSADSLLSLLWGSAASAVAAVVVTKLRTQQNLGTIIDDLMQGMQSMLFAVVILVLAWALMGVNELLDTQGFLVSLLYGGSITWLLPSIVFILASVTAFSTGTSWGTMGVLVPLTVSIGLSVTGGPESTVFLACCASVLSGAVLGDHCSPISDTTILSSIATQCDHIEHVRTQLPYAAFAGAIALVCGLLPAGFGLSAWIALPISVGVLVALFFALSSKVEV